MPTFSLALDVDLTATVRMTIDAPDLPAAKRKARTVCEAIDAVSCAEIEQQFGGAVRFTELSLNLPPPDEHDSQPHLFEVNGEDCDEILADPDRQ